MNRIFPNALAGALLQCFFGPLCQSQNTCADILLHDLGTKQVLQSSQDSSLAIANARCAQNTSSTTSGSSTSAGGSYAGIGANFGQNNSNSGSQSASDCGNGSTDQHFSAALFYAHTAYHDVVDAWKTCMTTRQEMACWAQPNGDDLHLTVHVSWTILGANPTVANSNVRIGSRPSSHAFNQGSKLFLGDNLVYVDRNANEDVTVDVQATSDNIAAKTCSVWIPKREPPSSGPPPIVIAHWVPQAPVSVPPPGICRCISSSVPTVASGPDGPFPHAPYPEGAQASFTNNCGTDVQLWGLIDRSKQGMTAPVGFPSLGRSYTYETLRPAQSLKVDLEGGILGIFQVNSCPSESFMVPNSFRPVGNAPFHPGPAGFRPVQ